MKYQDPNGAPNLKLVPRPTQKQDEVQTPGIGQDLRVQAKVNDILSQIPGGQIAKEHFGTNGGVPKFSRKEAKHRDLGMNILAGVSNGKLPAEMISQITQTTDQLSTIDPAVIRALYKRNKSEIKVDVDPTKNPVPGYSAIVMEKGSTSTAAIQFREKYMSTAQLSEKADAIDRMVNPVHEYRKANPIKYEK